MKRHIMFGNFKQQRGLTMISWVMVLAVVSFCGMFAFNVVPMYVENTYIVSGLKGLIEPGTTLADMSDAEIKKKMQNFYDINNVRSEGAKKIVIDRQSKTVVVKIDYEIRSNLFYNIDVVTRFQNHLNSDHPLLCCKPIAEKPSAKY